jgi:hypothetical protein
MSVNQSEDSGRGFIADHKTIVYLLSFEIALFGTAILLDVVGASGGGEAGGNIEVVAGLLAAFAIALGVLIVIALATMALLQRV